MANRLGRAAAVAALAILPRFAAAGTIDFDFSSLDGLGRPGTVDLAKSVATASLELASLSSEAVKASLGIASVASVGVSVVKAVAELYSAMSKIQEVSSATDPADIARVFSLVDTSGYDAAIADGRSAVRSLNRDFVAPVDASKIPLGALASSLLVQSAHDGVVGLYNAALGYQKSAAVLLNDLNSLASSSGAIEQAARQAEGRSYQVAEILAGSGIFPLQQLAADAIATAIDLKDIADAAADLNYEATTMAVKVQAALKTASASVAYLDPFVFSPIAQANYSFEAPTVTDYGVGGRFELFPNNFSKLGVDPMPSFLIGTVKITSLPFFSTTFSEGNFVVTATREIQLPDLLRFGGTPRSSGTASLPFGWTVNLNENGRYVSDEIRLDSIGKEITIVFSELPSAAFWLLGSIASPFEIIDIVPYADQPGVVVNPVPEPSTHALLALGLIALLVLRSAAKAAPPGRAAQTS